MFRGLFERVMIEAYTDVSTQATAGAVLEESRQAIMARGRRVTIVATRRDNLTNGEGVFVVSARTSDNDTPQRRMIIPSQAFPDREAALKEGRKRIRRRKIFNGRYF